MAKLIYAAITSLDGYIEDAAGNFAWAQPDEEVFSFVNGLERPVGISLYGRRMYETMVYWETVDAVTAASAAEREFTELWRGADKVVYSTSLNSVSSARTRLERTFDPMAIRRMKDAEERDITVAGAALAAQAFGAGLVDELQLFLTPVLVGGGKPALPQNVHLELELYEERRFSNGVVFLRYHIT
jgi:dihydrofolate reductase